MFTFSLPVGALKDVKAFGGGFPPDDYYAVKILRIEPVQDDPNSGKLVLAGEGHEIWEWIHTAAEANPTNDKKITDRNKNNEKKLRSILDSLGYAQAQIETGAVNHVWFLFTEANPRWGYISYVAPVRGAQKGETGSTPQINWLTKERYDALKAAGQKPERQASATGGNASGAQPATFQAPPSYGAPPTAGPPAQVTTPGPVSAPPQAAPATAPGFTPPPPPAR
jgi:hypothetical protein